MPAEKTRLSDEERALVDRLCCAGLKLEPTERANRLEELCSNARVLDEALRLLEGVDQLDDEFLDAPPPLPELEMHVDSDQLPEWIGPYRIEGKQGSGGFGVILRAHQTRPIDRDVAIKILKTGMDSHAIVERFVAERQVLAMMNHPGIATIFDAGMVPEGTPGAGRPYFVLEFVDGTQLTQFCDIHRLTVRERLELFMEVCDAVQHAHNKGIIHRDLKPSNILAWLDESSGRAHCKIIDFGIAKALQGGIGTDSMATRPGSFVGTPAYMSPEQVSGPGKVIDTKTDVYSLGVVLHELLTGERPFGLEGKTPFETMRIIVEADPRRPSNQFGSGARNVEARATARRATAHSLRRAMAGDLDWIVTRCLSKDPDERYETAHALAADMRRSLQSEPISAGPPTRRYRLSKFVRRNRTAVVAAAAVCFAMMIGLLGLGYGYINAERSRRVAEAALVQRAAAVEIDELRRLRRQFDAQDRLEDAVAVTRREFDLSEEVYGATSYTTSIAESHYAYQLLQRGRAANGADGMLQEVHEYVQWSRDRHQEDLFRTTQSLAIAAFLLIASGESGAAEPLARECYERRQIAYPDGHEHAWLHYNAMSLLGEVLLEQGRFSEARPLLVEAASWMLGSSQMPHPEDLDGVDRRRQAVERTVRLYERWHAEAPRMGYDRVADGWRSKL